MVRSVVQSEACLYGAFDSTTELPRRQIMNPPNEDIESPLCTRSCSRPVSACWRGLLDEVVGVVWEAQVFSIWHKVRLNHCSLDSEKS